MERDVRGSLGVIHFLTCLIVVFGYTGEIISAFFLTIYLYMLSSTLIFGVYEDTNCSRFEIMFPNLLAFIFAVFWAAKQESIFLWMSISFIFSPFFFDYIKKMLSIEIEKEEEPNPRINVNVVNTFLQTLLGTALGLLINYLLKGTI